MMAPFCTVGPDTDTRHWCCMPTDSWQNKDSEKGSFITLTYIPAIPEVVLMNDGNDSLQKCCLTYFTFIFSLLIIVLQRSLSCCRNWAKWLTVIYHLFIRRSDSFSSLKCWAKVLFSQNTLFRKGSCKIYLRCRNHCWYISVSLYISME